jgi:heme/copper-type cytochrome/quinol oxidase subunit 2
MIIDAYYVVYIMMIIMMIMMIMMMIAGWIVLCVLPHRPKRTPAS